MSSIHVIRFKCDDISKCSPGEISSNEENIENDTWTVTISKVCTNKKDGIFHLQAALKTCRYMCTLENWSVNLKYEYRLVKKDGSYFSFKDSSVALDESFSVKHNLMKWDDLMKPENGYVDNDSIFVEAHILRYEKIYKTMQDFKENTKCRATKIFVWGEIFYVDKSILAIHSGYFYKLFYDPQGTNQYKIDGVTSYEFSIFLDFVYSVRKQINDNTADAILKLVTKFEMPEMVKECSRLIIESSDIPMHRKMILSEKYGLSQVQDHIIENMKSKKDISLIMKSVADDGDEEPLAKIAKHIVNVFNSHAN